MRGQTTAERKVLEKLQAGKATFTPTHQVVVSLDAKGQILISTNVQMEPGPICALLLQGVNQAFMLMVQRQSMIIDTSKPAATVPPPADVDQKEKSN